MVPTCGISITGKSNIRREWVLRYFWCAYYHTFINVGQYGNYGDMVYPISIFHTKCSILLLILRVFCSIRRNTGYWLSQGLIVVNAIFYLAYFFTSIFQCSPRTKIWTPEEPGSCLNIEALYVLYNSKLVFFQLRPIMTRKTRFGRKRLAQYHTIYRFHYSTSCSKGAALTPKCV